MVYESLSKKFLNVWNLLKFAPIYVSNFYDLRGLIIFMAGLSVIDFQEDYFYIRGIWRLTGLCQFLIDISAYVIKLA